MTISARDQLLAYYMVGANFQAMLEGRPMPYVAQPVAPSPPKIDPEYTEGYQHAMNGGKLKQNPHEGASAQWWAWNNGYKAAKEVQAREQRQLVRRA